MKKTASAKRPLSAERIALLADKGKNISTFFSNKGRMMPPIQRVNVDFTVPMLEELDREAEALNISRQAVIKTLLRRALDERLLVLSAHAKAKPRQQAARV